MNPRDVLDEAIAALDADRRQALLALAGILFGVAAIVSALAIGEGARREAVAEVEGLGIDNVIVRPAAPGPQSRRRTAASELTLADARALAHGVTDAVAVAPVRSDRVPLVADDRTIPVTTLGVTAEWRLVTGVAVREGRWLTPAEVRDRRRVAVVGAGLAARLFDAGAATGRAVKLGRDWYRVVGVLAPGSDPATTRAAVSRVDLQNAAIVPLTALDARSGQDVDAVDEIAVRAAGADRVSATAAATARVLHDRLPADAIELVVPRELVAARVRARRAFDAVLLSIGALVLGVSGLGMMNVMLTGIARRTTEIGVRRAVGARRRDIVAQFTAETALLCAAGGVAGVPAGVAMSAMAGALAGWRTDVAPGAIVLALTLAVAVGVAFGIYPARVAAGLTPCEALRAD